MSRTQKLRVLAAASLRFKADSYFTVMPSWCKTHMINELLVYLLFCINKW